MYSMGRKSSVCSKLPPDKRCANGNDVVVNKLAIFGILAFILFAPACFNKLPAPPDDDPFVIYSRGLQPGFDIGVDDSRQVRNWLFDNHDYLTMAYPAGLESGTVFFTSGAMPLVQMHEDFSKYNSIQLELRGKNGGENVIVAIEDNTLLPSTPQFILNLDSVWTTFTFPISTFGDINRASLRNVIRFCFSGACEKSIDVRDIRYRKVTYPGLDHFTLFAAGQLLPGYAIGDTLSSGSNNMLTGNCDYMAVDYPSGETWGSVFIYSCEKRDLTGFDTLCIDLKGDVGQVLRIGISDTLTSREVSRYYHPCILTGQWKKYPIPLSEYYLVDLSNIYVACAILCLDENKISFQFKNIIYH